MTAETHTLWADQVKAGDRISVGTVSDRIIEQSFTEKHVLDSAAWLLVDRVMVADDGYTDMMVELPNGVPTEFDIPSAERVTVQREGDSE